MSKTGPEFYDEPEVFNTYMAHRMRQDTPNETIEQPILWDLIGDASGLDVLDLGCGDARVAKNFQMAGAKSYLGIEGSKKMYSLAEQNAEHGFSKVVHSTLEDYSFPEDSFDLVVSSLALHYVGDLTSLFGNVRRSLKPKGRFVFSVEHPVITSCNKALEASPIRQAWIVDNYFHRGPRTVQWMGDTVTIYHRTIEDFLNELGSAGFKLAAFRESDPPTEHCNDVELLARRQRIPLFLILSAST